MPTVIRRSEITLTEKRREILHAVGWQVMPNLWSPPTDIFETEKAYIVRVEVAGMRDADFEITLEDGHLFINGIRPDLPERRAYHQMEIRFGKFSTVIAIPGPVDLEKSEAEYKDGFLSVTLPKQKPTNVKVEE
ncbi:MAG: Hsp20/alpha crystallin family protein [Chloroflexi bacterium]|nr:Hsp20/alpha crystallin family protein [Chloroflexota bacterium]MBI3339495.1 Hsp20/alpha crystallin family protein [Chloroflexota bacterium]